LELQSRPCKLQCFAKALLRLNCAAYGWALQEGLGVVKVTATNPKGQEKVFISCISPTPLEYANVRRGIHHRKYLEMDPRFADSLEITNDTEASI